MIATKQELLAWVNEHADDGTLIHDLGDVLLSDTVTYRHSDTGSVAVDRSWRTDQEWLYKCLDWRDENCTCDRSTWSAISSDGSQPLGS